VTRRKAPKERLLKAKKKRLMMMMTQKRDMKVPRILSHMKPEGGQRTKIWTRILTRTRR
jgi:hypothetical protein